jgi:hypothetical protein
MFAFKNLKILYKNLSGKKIAIIIPSKKILSKEFGKKIDSFDYVIRLNCSEVVGYENYVGSKTSLRVINYSIFKNRENKEFRKQFPVLDNYYLKNKDLNHLVLKLKNKPLFIPKHLKGEYYILERSPLRELFNYLIKNTFQPLYFIFFLKEFFLNNKIFSLGFVLINELIIKGFDVTIFGLDFDEKQRSHYFMIFRTGTRHHLSVEKKILRKLLVKKKIAVCENS